MIDGPSTKELIYVREIENKSAGANQSRNVRNDVYAHKYNSLISFFLDGLTDIKDIIKGLE